MTYKFTVKMKPTRILYGIHNDFSGVRCGRRRRRRYVLISNKDEGWGMRGEGWGTRGEGGGRKEEGGGMRDEGWGMRDEGVTDVSSPLSVPSHPRSFGRPLFSLCPGRGTSLLEFDCVACAGTYGHQPLISEVLAESTFPPAASRVPARP